MFGLKLVKLKIKQLCNIFPGDKKFLFKVIKLKLNINIQPIQERFKKYLC